MSEIQDTLRTLRKQIKELEDKPKPVLIEPDAWIIEVFKGIPELREMLQQIMEVSFVDLKINIGIAQKNVHCLDVPAIHVCAMMKNEESRKNRNRWDFLEIMYYTKSLKRTRTMMSKLKQKLSDHIKWVEEQVKQ